MRQGADNRLRERVARAICFIAVFRELASAPADPGLYRNWLVVTGGGPGVMTGATPNSGSK
jgi:predicted Rossmann-fold nucleotide-binding protein